MNNQYIVFFDSAEQEERAESLNNATSKIFLWLMDFCKEWKINSPSDHVSIVSFISPTNFRAVTLADITAALSLKDEIDVYVYSDKAGVVASAEAITTQRYLTTERHNKKNKLIEQKEKNIFKRLEGFEERNNLVQQQLTGPLQLLRFAENKLFAMHLRYHVDNSQMPLSIIDKTAGFVDGTCKKIIDDISLEYPTPVVVKKIADVLGIKPEDLWVNLTTHYFNVCPKADQYVAK